MNTFESSNAVIAGKNIVSFSPGIKAADRADLLDLMMYADSFASQTYRKNEHWLSWMLYYRDRLERSGCRLRSSIVKPPMVINNVRELDKIRIGFNSEIHADKLLDLARRSFKVAALNQYAQDFFEFGSDSGTLNTFQIVPCESLADGEISFLLCGLHANANVASERRGGDWRLNREMVVTIAGGVYSLSGQDFSAHRERIRSHLQQKGRFNIAHINI